MKTHQTIEIDEGRYRIFCAAGVDGKGIITVVDGVVHVHPDPAAAWKGARKLMDENGNVALWFMLSHAMILSRRALDKAFLAIAPADSVEEATEQLDVAGRVAALADDFKRHAILEAGKRGIEIPNDAASSPRAFIDWYDRVIGGELAEKLTVGDAKFKTTVERFDRVARSLPNNRLPESDSLLDDAFPNEIRVFLRVIGRLVGKFRRVPVKKEMFKMIDSAMPEPLDMSSFTRLLNDTGFQWLPEAKPGPKPFSH